MLECITKGLNIQPEFHDLSIGGNQIHGYGQKGPEGTRLSLGYLTMLKRYVYERADGGLEPSVIGFAIPNSRFTSLAGESGWSAIWRALAQSIESHCFGGWGRRHSYNCTG